MQFFCVGCVRNYKWTDDNKYSLNGYELCKGCFDARASRCSEEWVREMGAHHPFSDYCICIWEDECCSDHPFDDDYEPKLLIKCEACKEREQEKENNE